MEDFPLLPVTANNGALERAVKIEMSDSICLAACKNLFPSLFTPGFFMTMSAFSKSSMRCSPLIFLSMVLILLPILNR